MPQFRGTVYTRTVTYIIEVDLELRHNLSINTPEPTQEFQGFTTGSSTISEPTAT